MNNPKTGMWNKAQKMILKEIYSIGIEDGDEDYILASIFDIKVDKSGNIYICDFKDNDIKVFTGDGIFLRRIGREGAGPGDLFGPSKIALSNNNYIYVYQTGNRRMSVFSLDGKYFSSFPCYDRISSLVCDDKGNVIASVLILKFLTSNKNIDKTCHVYNNKGELLYSFGDPLLFHKSNYLAQYSSIHLCKNNQYIMCTHNYPYRMDFYTNQNKLKKTVTRECGLFTEPEGVKLPSETIPKAFVSRGELAGSIFFPDGKFLVTVLDHGDNFIKHLEESLLKRENKNIENKTFYDLYDEDGHFLKSFYIKSELGIIRCIDAEGYIYTTSRPGEIPRIRKYSISFTEK